MQRHYYENIEGWFDFQEVYKKAVERTPDGGSIIEIGSWLGRSLSFLLVEAANSGKNLEILAVDNFQGSVNESYHQDTLKLRNIELELRNNADRANYPYKLIRANSVAAAQSFAHNSADFVFIDASHDYGSVYHDIRVWLPIVKWGGMLAGHDYKGGFPSVALAVKTLLSQSEIIENGSSWLWHKQVPDRGSWIRTTQNQDESDWLIYIPFVNNIGLLKSALASIQSYEYKTILVDQSNSKSLHELHKGPLFQWNGSRHFTKMMNWIQRDAWQRGLKYFFFLHSDAEVSKDGVENMLTYADNLTEQGKKWGVIFSHYDAFCLFNMDIVTAIGCWDESFTWYVSDVDYYNRIEWAGYSQEKLPKACKHHHTSQTIRSLSEQERSVVSHNHSWALDHYRHKWGANADVNSNARSWNVPYNGRP